MNELNSETKLSTQQYWDDVLAVAKLPRVNTPKAYHYKVTMDFIDAVLRKKGYSTLIEVGCGSSGWLPYFAGKYDLKVSGIDYSEVGCRLAEENLKMLGVNYDEIICKDIFEPECTGGKQYDVVFSYGVVEHFDNPAEIIKIFSNFLSPGGTMITLVPNLNGTMGWLSKYFVRDIYNIHTIIDTERLKRMHTENELTICKNGYAGTFSLAVIPLAKSERWLFKKGSIQRKITSFSLNFMDKVLRKFLMVTNFNLPSKTFSPYVICISNKKTV